MQYLILRYSLSAEEVQWNCSKCILPKLRYEPGNWNNRNLLASRVRLEEHKRSHFLMHIKEALFSHLNMAVLRPAGLTAYWLALRPGFQHLAQRTGDRQACHTDAIWNDIIEMRVMKQRDQAHILTICIMYVIQGMLSEETMVNVLTSPDPSFVWWFQRMILANS